MVFLSSYFSLTLRRLYLWYKRQFKSPLTVPGIFAITPLFLFPLIYQDPYILGILVIANVYAVVAASWDMFTGFTGRFNFGQAFFFGIGAYVSGFLNLGLGLSPITTIPIAGMVAVATSLALGYPTLRLRGPYFALATLVYPLIMARLTFAFSEIFGGEEGLYGLSRLAPNRVYEYYASLSFMVLVLVIFIYLANSRLGLILESIREDEQGASALGINVTKYKLIAFMISGFFTGVAGGFYAHYIAFAGPTTFSPEISIGAIAMTVVGGIATIVGPIVGAYLLIGTLEILRVTIELRLLIYGMLLLIIILFFQRGLLGNIKKTLVEMRIRKLIGG